MSAPSWERAIQRPDRHTAYFSIARGYGEDRLNVSPAEDGLRACVADGHWGDSAAQRIVDFWVTQTIPDAREDALELVKELEAMLYRDDIQAQSRRPYPSEAAFLAINVTDRRMNVVGYGDCGLLVVRGQDIVYQAPRIGTWLGAFSHMGREGRRSVESALVHDQVDLHLGDCAALYSDGLIEWGHDEKLSITPEQMGAHFGTRSAFQITRRLGALAFDNHTRDDTSLMVYKAP